MIIAKWWREDMHGWEQIKAQKKKKKEVMMNFVLGSMFDFFFVPNKFGKKKIYKSIQ